MSYIGQKRASYLSFLLPAFIIYIGIIIFPVLFSSSKLYAAIIGYSFENNRTVFYNGILRTFIVFVGTAI